MEQQVLLILEVEVEDQAEDQLQVEQAVQVSWF